MKQGATMTINHPINDDLLMGYAAGRLSQAYDLVVATAVSLDDDARARLSSFEAMGGVLLDEAEPAPLLDDSFAAIMGRIAASPAISTDCVAAAAPRPDPVLPQPLREVLGSGFDALRWRSVGMGVRQIIIDGDDTDQASARLLSIPAGQAMPDHGHNGMEITLVLKGAFKDGETRFARGDVEVADAEVEHTPIAEPGSDCICLVVTDAPLRFNALLPRLAQRFMNI